MDEVIMVLGKIIQSIETAMEKQRSITFPDDVGQTVQSLEERLNGMLMMKTEDLENMGAASKDFTGRLARLCFGVTKETKVCGYSVLMKILGVVTNVIDRI